MATDPRVAVVYKTLAEYPVGAPLDVLAETIVSTLNAHDAERHAHDDPFRIGWEDETEE